MSRKVRKPFLEIVHIIDAEFALIGIRNTTTVFDNPERDRARLVSLVHYR